MSAPTVLYSSPEVNAISSLESHSSYRCIVVSISHCFNIYMEHQISPYYIWVFCLCICLFTTLCSVHRGQKIASDPLELELQMIVSYHEFSEMNVCPLEVNPMNVFSHCTKFPAPMLNIFHHRHHVC